MNAIASLVSSQQSNTEVVPFAGLILRAIDSPSSPIETVERLGQRLHQLHRLALHAHYGWRSRARPRRRKLVGAPPQHILRLAATTIALRECISPPERLAQ